MKETILQFGTGQFLRGFVEDFVQTMHDKGLYAGKVVLCQNLPGDAAARFAAQDNRYHLVLQGMADGAPVRTVKIIDCISRCVNPYEDYGALLALAASDDLRVVISNTTEAGICYEPEEYTPEVLPKTFPARLTALLYHRYGAHKAGLHLLPCELIDRNGDTLREICLRYAQEWALPAEFLTWLTEENSFHNTLVDRIVSGKDAALSAEYEDDWLDVAEPFALWVIEGNLEDELPLQRANLPVIWTDDAAPYKRQKVRILNGAHTAMVPAALRCGLTLVNEAVADADIAALLHQCLEREVLAVLGEEKRSFANAVMERFQNPYLQHRLQAIALHSVSKWRVRVLPTLLEYRESFGTNPKGLTFSLAALLDFTRNGTPNDLPEAVAAIRQGSVEDVLQNTALWGMNLSFLTEEVQAYEEKIETMGMREAIRWMLQRE